MWANLDQPLVPPPPEEDKKRPHPEPPVPAPTLAQTMARNSLSKRSLPHTLMGFIPGRHATLCGPCATNAATPLTVTKRCVEKAPATPAVEEKLPPPMVGNLAPLPDFPSSGEILTVEKKLPPPSVGNLAPLPDLPSLEEILAVEEKLPPPTNFKEPVVGEGAAEHRVEAAGQGGLGGWLVDFCGAVGEGADGSGRRGGGDSYAGRGLFLLLWCLGFHEDVLGQIL